MYVGEDRLADLPYPDTHSPPAPHLLVSTPRGRGELTLGKAMSLSPRAGGPVLEEGCWGPPSMTLSPGGGRTGLGFPLILPPPPNLPPRLSLPPAPAPQFFGVSLYIALWRDRGGRMDGVWGGSVIGGEKVLLGTPSSLTAVLYPALPPHPFLRLVLRLLRLHPSFFCMDSSPSVPYPYIQTPSRGQIYTYIKVVNM